MCTVDVDVGSNKSGVVVASGIPGVEDLVGVVLVDIAACESVAFSIFSSNENTCNAGHINLISFTISSSNVRSGVPMATDMGT
jgi:hypothetical protein